MASLATYNPRFNEQRYIFVGSSSESKPLAELITDKLTELIKADSDKLNLIPEPWYVHFDTDEKVINETFLDEFPNILEKCEFSIFIVSKDDLLVKRTIVKGTVRDNVWFEAGMFIGKRGRTKTYFFLNDNDRNEIHFPTDITGLTLPGVKWDTDIANLFLKKNKILSKHKTVHDAVEKRIKDDIGKFCEKLLKKVKLEILKPTISEEAIIITDGKKCFETGQRLVNDAQTRIYTTISFSKSLNPNPSVEEQEMLKALKKKIKEKKASFIRFMKTTLPKINDQKTTLTSFIKTIKGGVYETYFKEIDFDYLEVIVSDNNVLMVFPNYTGDDTTLHEKVAFGFLIKDNQELADIISAWLLKKIAK